MRRPAKRRIWLLQADDFEEHPLHVKNEFTAGIANLSTIYSTMGSSWPQLQANWKNSELLWWVLSCRDLRALVTPPSRTCSESTYSLESMLANYTCTLYILSHNVAVIIKLNIKLCSNTNTEIIQKQINPLCWVSTLGKQGFMTLNCFPGFQPSNHQTTLSDQWKHLGLAGRHYHFLASYLLRLVRHFIFTSTNMAYRGEHTPTKELLSLVII